MPTRTPTVSWLCVAVPGLQTSDAQMMDYCLEDARVCRDVFKAMLPDIVAPQHGLAQALLRGRTMRACAHIEHNGIPVDPELLPAFEANWPAIRRALIEATDPGRYDCFEDGVFKRHRFEELLKRLGISRWPRTETGLLSLKDRTFREQIVTYPELGDLHELYATLQQMKSFDISVGPDGRHRPAMLSPFGTDTARHNAGKARKEDKGGAFIFGLARWFRGLIKPEPGMAIVYSDYASEEIAIAAVAVARSELARGGALRRSLSVVLDRDRHGAQRAPGARITRSCAIGSSRSCLASIMG